MSTTKRVRWLRIPGDLLQGMYELKTWDKPIDPDKLPDCPCCKKPLVPGFDVCQWGMFEDKYTSYLVCEDDGKAWELNYTVPTYDLFPKRVQKQLFSSVKGSGKQTTTGKDGKA